MRKAHTITYKGKRYTYDDRGWYGSDDFLVPPTTLISVLEQMLPEDIKREIVVETHKKFIETRGLTYRGVRQPMEHRTTHCYYCQRHLDNLVDLECNTCGWIICRCGACGCGYHQ